MTVSISPARPSDVGACATLLTAALGEDDVLHAIIRGADRGRRLSALFTAQMRSGAIQAGTVDVARADPGPIAGVALWEGPGRAFHPIERLREAAAVGWRHLAEVHAFEQEFGRHRPAGPHWYLNSIGVDPARHGLGIGSRLLEDRLRRIDGDGLPAYLEATTDASRRLYERHGFRFLGTIAASGVTAAAMLRPAAG